MDMRHLVLAAVSLQVVCALFDTTVCTQPASYGPPRRPTLPPTFEVHIECTIINKDFTTEVHEIFDQPSYRGEVRQTEMGVSFYGFYDYSTNEFLRIFPQEKLCQVSDLTTSYQRILFGYKPTGMAERIFTLKGALHFDSQSVVEQYHGKDIVRGINALKWYSCQYWREMDATMNVTWYFSDPNDWDTALSLLSIPLRAWVKGKVGGSNPHPFEHIYDISFFRNFIETPHAFETPDLISCPNRKLTRPFPAMAPTFSQTVEIVDLMSDTVSVLNEWQDSQLKLVRYDQFRKENFDSRTLTEIHDFNTGMKYVFDNKGDNCSWQPIENNDAFQTKNAIDLRMTLGTFHNNTTSVTYEGVKSVRDMLTYTYVGKKIFPIATNSVPTNATIEWHFLKKEYKTVQQKLSVTSDAVPIQQRLAIPSLNMDYTYNIYNYIANAPGLHTWDVRPCSNPLKKRTFQFLLQGKNTDNYLSEHDVLVAITKSSGISPLNIGNVMFVKGNNLHVRFDLVDLHTNSENSLSNLTKAIDSLNLYISGKEGHTDVAVPKSLEEVKESNNHFDLLL